MKFRLQRFLLLFSLPLLLSVLPDSGHDRRTAPHTMISARLQVRKLHNSYRLEYDMLVLYKTNGEFITYFGYPNNYYVLSDTRGDLKLYNPASREVRMLRDDGGFPRGAFMRYVLNQKTGDMELPEAGFSQTGSFFEEEMKITSWENHQENRPRDAASRIEMAHEGPRLIYMAYFLNDGNLLRKNFYSKYASYGNLEIPQQITEISYLSRHDSIIEDTRFLDILLDGEANAELQHFSIPEDAIVK